MTQFLEGYIVYETLIAVFGVWKESKGKTFRKVCAPLTRARAHTHVL